MSEQGQILPGTLELLILKPSLLVLCTATAFFCGSNRSLAGAAHRARRPVPRAKFYELSFAGRKPFWEQSGGWNRLAATMTAALGAKPEQA